MLFKNSAIRSCSFNRVEKEYPFTCFIAVSLEENTVQLEVGTQSNYTTGLPPSLPRRVHQPLYFGKIPANLDTLWLPVKDPFFGCLRNINVNDKRVSTRRISEVHGAVSLHGCPVK